MLTMGTEFQYDVFLSHNKADKARVLRLAERLRAAGLRVWYDEWVVRPGDDIYLAIERGLEAARVQVLCLSPAALGSDWVMLERSTVLFRDPTNAGRRFIPLLLADCKLPATLRRYRHVDFRGETEAALEELLTACRLPTEEVSTISPPKPAEPIRPTQIERLPGKQQAEQPLALRPTSQGAAPHAAMSPEQSEPLAKLEGMPTGHQGRFGKAMIELVKSAWARLRGRFSVVAIAAVTMVSLAVLGWIAFVQTPTSDPFAVEPRPFSKQWLREPVERNRFLRLPSVDSSLAGVALASDGQRGWAVGDAGAILNTRDGGNSWQPQPSGSMNTLYAVTLTSDGLCGWAVGDAGTILRTCDGGNSWQSQTSGSMRSLRAVTLTSDGQRGWAVGEAGTILGTRDGGNSWQPQTSGSTSWLFAATFADDGQRGWAVGEAGTILGTRDGGNSWQLQSSDTGMWLYAVTFASDGQRGWAVGWNGTILNTRDGGNSWQPQTSDSTSPLVAVTFASDGERGWAVGEAGTILSTRDGGNSWHPQTSGSTSRLTAVMFTSDAQRGWAVADSGTILSTRDGGDSWQAQTSRSKSWLFAATFAGDGQRGWAVAGDGTILSTQDGGSSWHAQNSGSVNALHAVTFTDDGQRGWAVGDAGTILGTRDGGDSWQAQTSGSMNTLTAVAFTGDGQRGWAVGLAGTILSTRDGGNSWQTQTSYSTNWLHAVTFTSDGQRGWAVGDGGAILSTRDGGNSWQTQITGSTRTLIAVTFTSDGQRGWAVGESGTILNTHDFGNSWQAQISGSTSTLMAVTFIGDGQRGWAVGFTGTILSTHDFGNSWQRQTSGSVSRLTAVTFTRDGQRGWAVGFAGTILSTRDGGGTWVAATYARYPAPWFYAAAFLVLVAAVAELRFQRRRVTRVSSTKGRGKSSAAEQARPGTPSGLGKISVMHVDAINTTIAGSQTPAASNPTVVGVGDVVGTYRLEEKLGEGAMGVVFLAQHREVHNQKVAIKLLNPTRTASPSELERFKTEAESIARVTHPNVVRLYGFDRLPSGQDYIVMEFLSGESLDVRNRRKPLALSEVVHVGMQAAEALGAAHRANIVHRDIKPQNIFIAPTATDPLFAKVLDFGVAKLGGLGDSQPSMTLPGTLVGSPLYMSPEQCQGRIDVDERADVYSLGVVLFELLAERPPFQGNNAELIRQHISVLPPSLCSLAPTCPSSLGAIIDRALAKDRNGRFPTMQDLRAALAAEKDRLSRGEDPLAVAPTVDAAHSALMPDQPTPLSIGAEGGTKPTSAIAGAQFRSGQAPVRPAASSKNPAQQTYATVEFKFVARPRSSFNARKAELHSAMKQASTFSAAKYLGVAPRTRVWPSCLQDRPTLDGEDKGFLWTSSRNTSSNVRHAESLRLATDGIVTFSHQVITAGSRGDPVVVRFEDLANDALKFILLTARTYAALRQKTGCGEDNYTIHLALSAPIRGRGACALFVPRTYVQAVQRTRAALLKQSPVAKQVEVSAAACTLKKESVSAGLVGLVNAIAEAFELETDGFSSGSPLLELDEDGLRNLVEFEMRPVPKSP